MKLIDKYIAKTVMSAVGLVTLMLAGLQIFILFVGQLDDLGKGGYGIVQAAGFVMMQLPYQIYLFFPMASLLGCLVGLSVMAGHSELVVMRAAGLSIGQITWAILKAALLVILLVTLLGETLIPRLTYASNNYKMAAMSGGQALRTAHGVWLRQGNQFINIGAVLPGNELNQVYQFVFTPKHQLALSRLSQSIHYEQGQWMAYQVSQTRFTVDKTEVEQIARMPWDIEINPQILKASGNEPDEMSLSQLRRTIREQQRNHQTAVEYRLSYWQRLVQPLTTVVMMILAIPFIFGPLRSSPMGAKLLAGATVGFGFYIVNRFFGPVSLVYQWPPEWAAVGPTLIFALLGLYMMRRVR